MTIKLQKKKGLLRPDGSFALRISHRKELRTSPKRTVLPRYKVKCGCCEESLEIFYDRDGGLEINGVEGSIENWREILLPLLNIKMKDGELEDISLKVIRAKRKLSSLRKKYPYYAI